MTVARSPSAHLDWVVDLAWPPSDGVVVAADGAPRAGWRRLESFAVLPNASQPRLLVPLGARKAASEALRRYTGGKRSVRLAKPLLTAAVRAGFGGALLRDRLHVYVARDAHLHDLRGSVLKEHLRDVLGRRDLEIAITFSPGRPQQKPAVHLLSSDGEILGYAKVAWNDVTRPLVRNEARVLAQLRERDGGRYAFEFPRLVHAAPWRDLDILIVAPFEGDRGMRRGGHITALPIQATRELALVSTAVEDELRHSAYWRALEGRIARTASVDREAFVALGKVARSLEARDGTTPLHFGFSHGDWVPWNMRYFGNGLCVWDWEHAADGVPVGFDAVHFALQVALNLRKQEPMAAVRETLARTPALLETLAVRGELAWLLVSLNLLEMSLRFVESRAAGVDVVDRKYIGPLTSLTAAPTSP